MKLRKQPIASLVRSFLYLVFAGLTLHAQLKVYDPMLDPNAKIVPQKEEEWRGSYMWYPGQYSAHAQKNLRKESKARCTNVGYPGNFNKEEERSFFRKKVKLKEETTLRWSAPGDVVFYLNGEKISNPQNELLVKKGETELLFEIRTEDRLPCLILDGANLLLDGWEASLDGKVWNIPETYSMYNKPFLRPDDKQERVVQIKPHEIFPLVNTTRENETIQVGKRGLVLIDFNHLEVGQVRLSVKGSGRLSFQVGESPEEALNTDPKKIEQNALPVYELTGSEQEILLPERAVRYLCIMSEEACEITAIQLDANLWPVEYQMSFDCSDPTLNAIWNAGLATLHSSMHSFYLDGIKRDYLPWAMDAVISALAGDYLFGDEQISRNGLSIALTPPNPQASDLGIVDYPLHALVGFKQDYLRYGNIETSLMYKDRIIQMLDFYSSLQDANGFISSTHSTSGFIPGWANWEGPSPNGIAAYGQIMLYYNYVTGAYFARLWKENKLAAQYEQKATTLRNNIMTHFWDEDRKAFINGYTIEGKKDERISHHAQYWAILAGLYPEKYYDHLFTDILPNIPYYKTHISYEKGYEFLAYIKAGHAKDALAFLMEIWGDWLNLGHVRFPENFSPQASRSEQLVFYHRPFGLSLCHGGNGVPPIIVTLHGIFGFSQSEKKINEYYLRPDLLGLEWAKGRIPIKEGFITIDKLDKHSIKIEIPKNCVVHIQKEGKTPLKTFKKAGKYEVEL